MTFRLFGFSAFFVCLAFFGRVGWSMRSLLSSLICYLGLASTYSLYVVICLCRIVRISAIVNSFSKSWRSSSIEVSANAFASSMLVHFVPLIACCQLTSMQGQLVICSCVKSSEHQQFNLSCLLVLGSVFLTLMKCFTLYRISAYASHVRSTLILASAFILASFLFSSLLEIASMYSWAGIPRISLQSWFFDGRDLM